MLVAIGFYSAWLFSIGHYWTGVLGAFLSLAASVLDGCDGEIARLKYQESALGCWIETVGDYSYYLAIFVGLTIGAVRQTGWEGFYWLGGHRAGRYAPLVRAAHLPAQPHHGRPAREAARDRARRASRPSRHCWSRLIWRISFVATRAAMPYGIMAFALDLRAARDRRPRRDRREHLLGEPGLEAAAFAGRMRRPWLPDNVEIRDRGSGIRKSFEISSDGLCSCASA